MHVTNSVVAMVPTLPSKPEQAATPPPPPPIPHNVSARNICCMVSLRTRHSTAFVKYKCGACSIPCLSPMMQGAGDSTAAGIKRPWPPHCNHLLLANCWLLASFSECTAEVPVLHTSRTQWRPPFFFFFLF